MGQRVLLTGAAGRLARGLARRLADDDAVEEVIGVDRTEPAELPTGVRFVHADIRSPQFVAVLRNSEADTVVHLNLLSGSAGAADRGRMKEINVIGAMQLFAACQRLETLRTVVTKSTTGVYGSEPGGPGVFTEEMGSDARVRGYAKDAVEVEGYARAFARRRPDVSLTTLRFANVIGPRIRSPLVRYLCLPVAPTPLGYDPRLELIHEDDAVEVLYRMTTEQHPGIYNVSADGVVFLSQALRLLGVPPLPLPPPLGGALAAAVRRLGLVDVGADELPLVLHGRVTDAGRLKRELGWEPKLGTREALMDFARSREVARSGS